MEVQRKRTYGKYGLYAIAAVAVLTLLWLAYLALTFEPTSETSTVVVDVEDFGSSGDGTGGGADGMGLGAATPPPVLTPPPDIDPTAAAVPDDAIQVPEDPLEADSLPLPSLNNSDDFVRERLATLDDGPPALRLLARTQLVRKFVVLVANASEAEIPQTELPYRRLEEEMPVQVVDDNLYVMDERAPRRFDPYVDAFLALDPEQTLALYRWLAPLFQQAYAELGYRGSDFDDVLLTAIDRVLQSEPPPGPYQLVKPSVMYLYADSSIEGLDAIDKQLIRLGPTNTARIKARLMLLRSRL